MSAGHDDGQAPDFEHLLGRATTVRTEWGLVTVSPRRDGIWVRPGNYLISYDELYVALEAIRCGQFRVGRIGKSPVIAAVIEAVGPDVVVPEGRGQAMSWAAATSGIDWDARRSAEAEARRARIAEKIRLAEAAAEVERALEKAAAEARAAAHAAELRDAAQREAQREAERRALEARREALLKRIQTAYESDFLGARDIWLGDPDQQLVPEDEVERIAIRCVQAWALRRLSSPLDEDQARAVATVNRGDVKVVARAGSGKTRTLTARAAFLQEHCHVSPREMLLLAFNRNAAMEMKDRLKDWLGDELPHVMTFHALAYALLHPQEDLLFDDASSGNEALSREVQDVIDEHVRSPEWRDTIRDVMLAHFREDWDIISEGGYDLAMDDFLAERRSLPRETLAGETVKSFGERLIANGLFENDVRYAYERNFRWSGLNYRPDFTVLTPTGGVAIEYFGLKGDPDYDEEARRKREFWAGQPGWTLLEYSPRDITSQGPEFLVQRMLDELQALGVSHRRKTDEEIWQEIRQRAIGQFTKTVRNFVGRCRKRNLSTHALAALVAGHPPASTTEQQFLDVAQSVYAAYLERLKSGGKDDFDGWMWRASAALAEGQTGFARDHGKEHGDIARLRYVLVDEFQDFSEQFYRLLQGIRNASPSVEFFCVGDDWQAINGFAGADLRYFREFDTLFRSPVEREITTNYRSVPEVVRAGNALMYGLGSPAKAFVPDEGLGSVMVGELNAFTPSAIEQERHRGDELTPAILRLVRHHLDRGLSVTLLARRNNVSGYVNYPPKSRQIVDGLERFLDHVRSFLPETDRERVTIRTAHRSKGLEDHAVIILDANEGSYPLIHPSWVFLRVFGDSVGEIVASERRLFYVAVTRAQENLAILTDKRRVSPYVQHIDRSGPLPRLSWASLPPVAAAGSPLLEIRAYDSYSARDRLKNLHYRYQGSGQYWWTTAPAEGFSLEGLLGQDWVPETGRIMVLSESGETLHDVFPDPSKSL